MAFSGVTVGRGKYLRPTSVRKAALQPQTIAMEVIGLRQIEKIPDQLQMAYANMILRLEESLVASLKSVVPGSPEGRVGSHVFAKWMGNGRVVVGVFGTPFAYALNRGFTSTAKNGKALRFIGDGGEVVFRKKVRVRGRQFFEQALLMAPSIIEAVYESSFFDITESGMARF